MDKETSVCDCAATSEALSASDTGFKLDEKYGIIIDSAEGHFVVRYCFSCGGLLPDATKPIWYPKLDATEYARIQNLLIGLDTAEQAIEKLGPPDYDAWLVQYNHPEIVEPIIVSEHEAVKLSGWVYNEEESMKCRQIVYFDLPEAAQVQFFFRDGKLLNVEIMIKNLPPRHIEEE